MGSKWVFKDFSSALENKTRGFLMLSRQLGQNYQVLVLTPKLENSEFLKPSPGPSGKACTHTRPKEEGSISRNGADTHPLPRRQQQTQHIPCHSWCFLSSALAWPTFFSPSLSIKSIQSPKPVASHFLCFSLESFQFYSEKWKRKWSHSVVSDSLWPHGLQPASSSVHGIFQARVLECGAISSGIPRTFTTFSQMEFCLCNYFSSIQEYVIKSIFKSLNS